MYDVAVVGAGAAGLTAAIFAARGGARVIALDGAKKLGAKILISGGGRCNVTHDVVDAADFNGSRNAIAKVLRSFSVEETIEWFASMGIRLKREETGKLFPTSDRAITVLNALVREAESAGVEIRTGARVEDVVVDDRRPFVLNGSIEARTLILATGGKSVPKTGSDGGGYTLAQALGHTITHTFPALVPLVIEQPHWIKEMSGMSADVELTVRSSSGKVVHRDRGSLLMTHFGISGPVVLDVSRHWIATGEGATLSVNFLPGEAFESVDRLFIDSARKNPRATVASVLRGRVAERVLTREPRALASLSRDERRRVARELTDLVVPVTRDRGFNYAEVTAGGVPLDELNLATMESRITRNLYLCGEILDVDGRIGGYNFQWAWATGRLAGRSAAKR